MAFTIVANNKTYTIIDHAALRMLERDITEQMVIDVLENGMLTTQPHGRDVYEAEIVHPDLGETLVVQVVIDEAKRIILTVIDITEGA
ncbi:MAG: DUF4258 domain-containing protein [bacterium]|nr:DUF4258 domain-containing protein [bacterium]